MASSGQLKDNAPPPVSPAAMQHLLKVMPHPLCAPTTLTTPLKAVALQTQKPKN